MEPMQPQVKKSGKGKTVIIIVAIILALAAIAAGVFLILRNTPARRFQRQIDLGNRYLTELRYDDAIAAFEAALTIDPKRPEPYGGLVEAYFAKGDAEAIVALCERANGQLSAPDMQALEEKASERILLLSEARDTEEALSLLTRAAETLDSEKLRERADELMQEAAGINLLDWLGQDAVSLAAAHPQIQSDYYSNFMTGVRTDIPPYYYVEENGNHFLLETYTPWATFWDESEQGNGTIIRIGDSWLYGGIVTEGYHMDGVRSGMDITEIVDILLKKGWAIEPGYDYNTQSYDFSRRSTWCSGDGEIGGVMFYRGKYEIWVCLDSFEGDGMESFPAVTWFDDPDSYWANPHGTCTTISCFIRDTDALEQFRN